MGNYWFVGNIYINYKSSIYIETESPKGYCLIYYHVRIYDRAKLFWSEKYTLFFLVNKTNKANNKLHRQQKLALWDMVVLFRSHYWGCNIKLWSWCKYIIGLIPPPSWLVYSHLLSSNAVTHLTRTLIFSLMFFLQNYFVCLVFMIKITRNCNIFLCNR